MRKLPRSALPYYQRGTAYMLKGNFNQAILDLNKAIAIDPYIAEVYVDRGIAYQQEGNSSLALADYNKAWELIPGELSLGAKVDPQLIEALKKILKKQ